jgi:hypothetical protein
MTSQAEPTGLNIDDMKFTRMITVLNGRRHSHVPPANTESDIVTVTNSTAAIQSLSEHRGALITAHKAAAEPRVFRLSRSTVCVVFAVASRSFTARRLVKGDRSKPPHQTKRAAVSDSLDKAVAVLPRKQLLR